MLEPTRRDLYAPAVDATVEPVSPEHDAGLWTVPNLVTVIRLCCLPLFLWLLLGRDDRQGAAWLLGAIGATDWVDGYVARRFNQVSEIGKILDPTADRLLFIVGITGILIDGGAPRWFCWLTVAREVVLGGTVAALTLFRGMKRFDVTWWGKTATFMLMFAFPGFLLGASNFSLHTWFNVAAWIIGIPGLILSYYVAFAYVPTIVSHLRAGDTTKHG